MLYLVDYLRDISIGRTPTIDILYGLPSDNYYFFVNPPKLFSQESPPALTPIVLGCPNAYGMHDANSNTIHITHANIYNMIYIYII